jgi:hypothetical protein
MRALTACFTVVLGLGMAAMAACSSTSSDDTAAGGSAGSTVAGGTGGTVAEGGAGGSADSCAFVDNCAPCIATNCLAEETACIKEEACDTALTGTDGLASCACDPTKTPADCTATFTATDATAKAVTDCAAAHCATECGL